MALLGKAELMSKDTLKSEKVVLDTRVVEPEVLSQENGTVVKEAVVEEDYVFVRQMTGHEKSIWELSQVEKSGQGKKVQYDVTLDDYRAKLAVVCVCDEKGELLFRPNDYKQFAMNISAAKLEKIVDVAQRLNAITEEDREEIVKNS